MKGFLKFWCDGLAVLLFLTLAGASFPLLVAEEGEAENDSVAEYPSPPDGITYWWYPSGEFMGFMSFKNGKAEGESKGFHQNGKIARVLFYKNGLRSGRQLFYHDCGALWIIENFENGKRHGVMRTYDRDGTLTGHELFENGVRLETSETEEFDEKLPHTEDHPENARPNPPDGVVYYWNPNGTIATVGHFNGGLATGEWKNFREDGELSNISFFENGLSTGTWTYYFESGEKMIENHKKGKLHGEKIVTDQDGNKIFYEEYIDGVRHGVSKSWGSNGDLIREEKFENGVQVE